MTVYNMFSVPIIHYPIANWAENKKKILDALPAENETDQDPQDSGLFTDFFSNSAAESHEMPDYAETIISVIKPYLAEFTDQRRVEFSDMWYQKYYKGVAHGVHNHGHSGWSSVIYVEYDPNLHPPTRFYSPFRDIWSGDCTTFEEQVDEGDMVIFPSTIMHEAPPNMSDVRRTIISYNLRGKVDTSKRVIQ